MSAKSEEVADAHDELCASCGVAAVDDITLKICDGGCDLVKYCSDECQTNHREHHEEECNKRKAEMHDRDLFTQPDGSYLGECPICCLPLPLDLSKSMLTECCSKTICDGCNYANQKREREAGLEYRCPYCRNPRPKSKEQSDKNVTERVKKNDPVVMTEMGKRHEKEGDCGKALEYYAKAADLGDVAAHCCLGTLYYQGLGVEKDMKKAIHHFEQAAIGGHPQARGVLGMHEKINGRFKRAARHLIIAANLGDEKCLQEVKALFVKGVVSKEEYAAALRGYQSAVDETKSAGREAAEEAERNGVYREGR